MAVHQFRKCFGIPAPLPLFKQCRICRHKGSPELIIKFTPMSTQDSEIAMGAGASPGACREYDPGGAGPPRCQFSP
ncbi:MAG: hypothetical protein AMXMBFR82_10960 [Candidatus Hydrogenedentota bacterium]